MRKSHNRLNSEDVLASYKDMPIFYDIDLHDVNQVGLSGDRPLHVACFRGKIKEAIALIDDGADIHAKGDLGQTPLFNAIMGDSFEVVKLILDKGGDPLVVDETGVTPLGYARTMLGLSKPDSGKIIVLLEEAVAMAKKQRELK